MRKTLIALLGTSLLFSGSAFGVITRTQAVSANATSVAITSTSANDEILVLAYNGAGNTVPTLPAGFTSLTTTAGTGNAFNAGYKKSSGGDTSSGTWTNATQVVCMVYAGADTTTPFVNATNNHGSGLTLQYKGFTMAHTDGTGWIAGAAGALAATAGMNNSTAVLVNRTNVTTANGLDTGTGVTSFANQSLAVTGGGAWLTFTVEIVQLGAGPTPTATPTPTPTPAVGTGNVFDIPVQFTTGSSIYIQPTVPLTGTWDFSNVTLLGLPRTPLTISGDAQGTGTNTINLTVVNLPDLVRSAGAILSAPRAPPSPHTGASEWFTDSTYKRFRDRNDTGSTGVTVVGDTGALHNFLTAIDPNSGIISKRQPTFADLTGTIGNTQGGIPSGGTGSQVLAKTSSADFATTWITLPGGGNVIANGTPANLQIAQWTDATHIQGIPQVLPAQGGVPTGGSTGQVLKKNTGSNYDYSWGGASVAGDFSSNTSTSVDSEILLFSGTTGKLGKRATGTGLVKVASGVFSTELAVSPAQGGLATGGTTNQVLAKSSGTDYDTAWVTPAAGGTVTNFTAGNLSPLFTTSVATSTTTPALTFSLSNAGANTVFSNNTGSTGAPAFTTSPSFTKIANLTTNGFVKTVSGDGTLSIDASTYLTANQTITLTGEVTGSGTTSIASTVGTMTHDLNVGTHKVTNVVDPTTAQQAATKNYVDTSLAAFQPLEAVYAASTANIVGTYSNGVAGVGATFTITATGALSMDGASPPINSRVLLKDQTTGFQNGVYDVTVVGTTGVSPVLTRSLDYNTASEMNAGDLIPVINGTVNATTSWLQTAIITTVGTDALVFTQYSKAPSSYQAHDATLDSLSGLTISGSGGSIALTTSPTFVTPILGTPTSGNLANCTFPTFNQNTTGSAASLSISGQTGLLTVTGLASTNRVKTVRDAADTLLELGGSYTPTGTWTSLTMVTPVLGTPTSGNLANCTFPTLNQNSTGSAASLSVSGQTGLMTVTGLTSTNRAKTVRDAADTILELGGSYTPTGTWTSMTLVTPALGTPASGVMTNVTGTANGLTAGDVTRNHVVYAGASPPTVDVGVFTISVTGVDLKTAGTTDIFTVPTGRTFICQKAVAVVTSVTTAGAGTENFKIIESGAGGSMTTSTASASGTPAAGIYYVEDASSTGNWKACAAGNKVQISVSTSQAGSTAVSGTVFVTGFYSG